MKTICAICKVVKKNERWMTVRQSWLDAGGFGIVPPKARAHPSCDKKEMKAIQSGKIKLSSLWKSRQ